MATCCFNCEERHKNCHSECEIYIKWKRDRDIEQDKIRANKTKHWQVGCFKAKQIEKTIKRKKR